MLTIKKSVTKITDDSPHKVKKKDIQYKPNNRKPVAKNRGYKEPIVNMFPLCFNDLTGSINSSILLNKAIQWWRNKKQQPFYKYKKKPESPKEQVQGLSWCDELGFTEDEFDSAFRRIGTVVTSVEHDGKIEEYGKVPPIWDEENRLANSHRMILRWRDTNKITWYWVNEKFIQLALHHLGYCINFENKEAKAVEYYDSK